MTALLISFILEVEPFSTPLAHPIHHTTASHADYVKHPRDPESECMSILVFIFFFIISLICYIISMTLLFNFLIVLLVPETAKPLIERYDAFVNWVQKAGLLGVWDMKTILNVRTHLILNMNFVKYKTINIIEN